MKLNSLEDKACCACINVEYNQDKRIWECLTCGRIFEPKPNWTIEKLLKENTEIRELNKAQVLENAVIRKENAELQQQLSNQKYLSREEVEKIIEEYVDIIEVQKGIYKAKYLFYQDDIKEIIDKICSLAIPNRDRIIEGMKSVVRIIAGNYCDENMDADNLAVDLWEDDEKDFEFILTEILLSKQDKGEK